MSTEWSLERAVEQFFETGFRDGEIVSHDWIKWALEVKESELAKDQFLLLERMDAFRTALLHEHQIALQNVRGTGYRVVPPSDQARYAAEEAAKYLSKGMRVANSLLSNTRMQSLTTEEKRRHTDAEIRMAGLRGMIGKGKRDVFALFRAE